MSQENKRKFAKDKAEKNRKNKRKTWKKVKKKINQEK